MKQVICWIAAVACIWLFSDKIAKWLPIRDEVTVYTLFCNGEREGAVCRGNEETANPTTYKVLVDQQSVTYWVGDTGRPSRFTYCAVHDVWNWSCQWEEAGQIPKSTFAMQDGTYAETTSSPYMPSTQLFYQVPKWRWWLVRLNEKLK